MHANCVRNDQLQPLLAGFSFLTSSVPPAPEEPPLQPLWELPAPSFSPLQALLPDEQPSKTNVDPVIRLATQKPARIFFRSFMSIMISYQVIRWGTVFPPGTGKLQAKQNTVQGIEIFYCFAWGVLKICISNRNLPVKYRLTVENETSIQYE